MALRLAVVVLLLLLLIMAGGRYTRPVWSEEVKGLSLPENALGRHLLSEVCCMVQLVCQAGLMARALASLRRHSAFRAVGSAARMRHAPPGNLDGQGLKAPAAEVLDIALCSREEAHSHESVPGRCCWRILEVIKVAPERILVAM